MAEVGSIARATASTRWGAMSSTWVPAEKARGWSERKKSRMGGVAESTCTTEFR